jgi:hypothetical protein
LLEPRSVGSGLGMQTRLIHTQLCALKIVQLAIVLGQGFDLGDYWALAETGKGIEIGANLVKYPARRTTESASMFRGGKRKGRATLGS